MKKVWLTMLMSVTLLITLAIGAFSIQAGSFVEDDALEYYISNDEAILTQCMKTYVYNVTIRDKVNGYPVTRIKSNAFKNCYQLTHLDIPDSVRQLQDKAFYRCFALETISIPDSVMSIGKDVFLETALYEESTNWENGVLYVGSHLIEAKGTVSGAYAVKIGTITIADGAFEDCTALAAVTIPDSVTNIGIDAFANTIVSDVWYSGAESDREVITIQDGNSALNQATWHYDICENEHVYSSDCDILCNHCEWKRIDVEDHAYDNDCDADCNSCGAVRDAGHTYDNVCDADCNNCGETREAGDHAYDDSKDPDCNNCGATRNIVTIVTAPKHTYVTDGATAKVTVGATGDGLKYQWYLRNDGQTKYYKSSITTNTYSVKMSDAAHNRRVYCVITDQYGNKVQTSTVILRRQATITVQPTNTYTANGDKAKTTVSAIGDGLKYTWYVKNAGQTKYTKSSITSATYSVTMSEKAKDRYAYCIVTDKYGKTVKSKVVVFRMTASIITEPTNVSVKMGAKARTTVTAMGDGLTYQWYVKNVGADAYVKSSITTKTYSATMSEKANGRLVYCVITDKYNHSVQTQVITLTAK